VISRVVVVVPAADEEAHIGACLRSLHAARRRLHFETHGSVRSRVVVVLDDCRDATASVVAGFRDVEAVVSTARCVGVARHVGALRALALERPARELWLASTDADCRVPSGWLTRMVDEARHGAQLVLGTVRPEPGLPLPVERAWLAAHQVRDDHPHIHGANLGLSALTYLGLGGWRPLPAHEDIDLVSRAAGHARILRTGAIPVLTSNRRAGRVDNGFSTYLDDLHDGLHDELSEAS
jgi:glycosyltransferase involved in cell wall biosynthesis